jgi:hypothetical protein
MSKSALFHGNDHVIDQPSQSSQPSQPPDNSLTALSQHASHVNSELVARLERQREKLLSALVRAGTVEARSGTLSFKGASLASTLAHERWRALMDLDVLQTAQANLFSKQQELNKTSEKNRLSKPINGYGTKIKTGIAQFNRLCRGHDPLTQAILANKDEFTCFVAKFEVREVEEVPASAPDAPADATATAAGSAAPLRVALDPRIAQLSISQKKKLLAAYCNILRTEEEVRFLHGDMQAYVMFFEATCRDLEARAGQLAAEVAAIEVQVHPQPPPPVHLAPLRWVSGSQPNSDGRYVLPPGAPILHKHGLFSMFLRGFRRAEAEVAKASRLFPVVRLGVQAPISLEPTPVGVVDRAMEMEVEADEGPEDGGEAHHYDPYHPRFFEDEEEDEEEGEEEFARLMDLEVGDVEEIIDLTNM